MIKSYRNGIDGTQIEHDWLSQFQDHKHNSHMQPPRLRFHLYRRKIVKYGVFSHCWCPFLTCAQTILNKNSYSDLLTY